MQLHRAARLFVKPAISSSRTPHPQPHAGLEARRLYRVSDSRRARRANERPGLEETARMPGGHTFVNQIRKVAWRVYRETPGGLNPRTSSGEDVGDESVAETKTLARWAATLSPDGTRVPSVRVTTGTGGGPVGSQQVGVVSAREPDIGHVPSQHAPSRPGVPADRAVAAISARSTANRAGFVAARTRITESIRPATRQCKFEGRRHPVSALRRPNSGPAWRRGGPTRPWPGHGARPGSTTARGGPG